MYRGSVGAAEPEVDQPLKRFLQRASNPIDRRCGRAAGTIGSTASSGIAIRVSRTIDPSSSSTASSFLRDLAVGRRRGTVLVPSGVGLEVPLPFEVSLDRERGEFVLETTWLVVEPRPAERPEPPTPSFHLERPPPRPPHPVL